MARQLEEVWQILAEDGLLMGDVVARLGSDKLTGDLAEVMAGGEGERWESMARLEGRIIEELREVRSGRTMCSVVTMWL